MRPWLLTAPWWALFLLNGSAYVLGLTLVGRYTGDENWTEALVSAVPFGVLFGAVMGPIMARNNRRFREAAGVLSPGRLRQAARLSRRGPVPVDPELRQAARRVALQERGELVRQRWWAVPFFASALVLASWLALTTALAWPGWLLVAVTVPRWLHTSSCRVSSLAARSCSPSRGSDRAVCARIANAPARTPRCVHTPPPGMLLG